MSRNPRYWLVDTDMLTNQSGDRWIENDTELYEAKVAFNKSLPGDSPWPDPIPAGFVRPRIGMSMEDTPEAAPDLWSFGTNVFFSERLRTALALPDWAVSYVPVEYIAASQRARDQRYSWVRLRAAVPVIDLEASIGRIDTSISRKTGNPYLQGNLDVIRFHADPPPPCGLFVDQSLDLYELATDDCAQRVIDAGCNGILFVHPLWRFATPTAFLIKTATGVEWMSVEYDEETERMWHETRPFSMEAADQGPDEKQLEIPSGPYESLASDGLVRRIAHGQ